MAQYLLRLAYTPSGVQQVTVCRVWSTPFRGMGTHLTLPILTLKSQAEFQQSHPGFLKWGEFKACRVSFKELLTTPKGRNHCELKPPFL